MREPYQEPSRRWIRGYLQYHGYYRNYSPTLTCRILREHIHAYFSGLTSTESLRQLSDELLFVALQKEKAEISPLLFAALTCASDPPSTRQRRVVWYRKLKKYEEKLNTKDFSGIIF